MLKKDRKYIALLIGSFLLLLLVEYAAPKPLNWTPTFSQKDANPYGAEALWAALPDLFPDQSMHTNYRSLYETAYAGDTLLENSPLFFFVGKSLDLDSLDTEVLLEKVEEGATVFAAASWFGGKLADTLNLFIDQHFFLNFGEEDQNLDSIQLSFTNASLDNGKEYVFKSGSSIYYFSSFDTLNTEVIGKNNLDKPNFVKVKKGEGTLYLHSNPLIFTNYNLMDSQNREYIERALSCLPLKPVVWDAYYSQGRSEARTPLRFILSRPALRWTYFLALAALVLFVVFEGKRKQRPVPIVKPPENTTLEFVETVGRLYFQHRDHANLARKKITFFKEYLRNTFYIKTNNWDRQTIEIVAYKSGSSVEEVSKLFQLIEKFSAKPSISEKELQELNERIEGFKGSVA